MRRTLLAIATAIGLLPYVAYAQEYSLDASLGLLVNQFCPSGSIYSCPTLDFLLAFGIVASVMTLGFNIVETFRDVNESAQKGLIAFALLAGLATAFYVWSQKIPFTAYLATYGLFFVVLVSLMAVAGLFLKVKGTGKLGLCWILMLVGIGLLILGMILIYFGLASIGAMALILGILGIIGTIICFILSKSGNSSDERRKDGDRDNDIDDAETKKKKKKQEVDISKVKAELKTGLADLRKLLTDLKLADKDLLKLYGLLHFQREAKEAPGFFAQIKEKKHFDAEHKKAKKVMTELRKGERALEDAVNVLTKAVADLKASGYRGYKIGAVSANTILGYCKAILKQLANAEAEMNTINNYIGGQAYKRTKDVQTISKNVSNMVSQEDAGLKRIFKETAYLIAAIEKLYAELG